MLNTELYTSDNNWVAWVAPDPVPVNFISASQERFVIVGFLPNRQFCIAPNSFESMEEAQSLISTFDQQTITFELSGNLIKVFTCFDGNYWQRISSLNGVQYVLHQIDYTQNTTLASTT